jgi:hypothetical protein
MLITEVVDNVNGLGGSIKEISECQFEAQIEKKEVKKEKRDSEKQENEDIN